MRRLAALTVVHAVVVAALAAVAPAVAVGDASADIAAQARPRPGSYARAAFAATNAQRVDHGLRPLRAADCLRRAAVRQARRMARREQLFHQDLDRVVGECGLSAAGENVAAGYPTGRSVVDDGWMSSAGHRANILDASFRLMGIGARRGHDGNWYVAQVLGRRG